MNVRRSSPRQYLPQSEASSIHVNVLVDVAVTEFNLSLDDFKRHVAWGAYLREHRMKGKITVKGLLKLITSSISVGKFLFITKSAIF